jgi:hypothetical protein
MNSPNNVSDKIASGTTGNEWSMWLDLNRETITSVVPETPGLFKVHASMKIIYMGSTQDLKKSLLDSLVDPCIRKGKRFSYLAIGHDSLEKLKREFLDDYKLRHNGNLPICMESK